MSTSNLTPEQRAAIKRMRKVLAHLLPEPERRLLVGALKEFIEEVALVPMRAEMERRNAEAYAISLAVEERIGHEPSGDELITPLDEKRAEEILEMYPRGDT
jgi:hypothetical protein